MPAEKQRAYGLLMAALFALTWLEPGTGAALAPLELDWSAPEECPAASFVEGEIARVVGRPSSEVGAEWKQARVVIAPENGGYRLRVSVLTEAGVRERSVVAASCTEATEAAVAILTAGMAPTDAHPERAPPPRTAAALQGRASTAEAAAVLDTRGHAGSRGPPVVPLLAASLGLDVGSLARVAPLAQLSSGLEIGPFTALALLGATGSVLGQIEHGAAGAEMFLWMGGLLGCWKINSSDVSVSGCGGVELGSLEARGFGTVDRRDGRAFWSASVARAALDWYSSDTNVVSLGADAVFPFRHLRVEATPETVHRTPSIAVRPWLGLGLRFR